MLDDVRADGKSLSVKVKPDSWSKYRIQFIGKQGRILREVAEPTATYTIVGDEGYVRARVLESNGRYAWVQPIMVTRSSVGAGAGIALLFVATVGLAVATRGFRR
jgi:hypothetical protein